MLWQYSSLVSLSLYNVEVGKMSIAVAYRRSLVLGQSADLYALFYVNRPPTLVSTSRRRTSCRLLHYTRTLYQCGTIYDAVKVACCEVDSLSPPSRSSVRTACARSQVTFGPTFPAPAPVDRPMDTHRLMVYRVMTYACFAASI